MTRPPQIQIIDQLYVQPSRKVGHQIIDPIWFQLRAQVSIATRCSVRDGLDFPDSLQILEQIRIGLNI